jgi:hypothetical protein
LHGVDEIVASGQSEPDKTPFRDAAFVGYVLDQQQVIIPQFDQGCVQGFAVYV